MPAVRLLVEREYDPGLKPSKSRSDLAYNLSHSKRTRLVQRACHFPELW
jgi:hypothetical protein